MPGPVKRDHEELEEGNVSGSAMKRAKLIEGLKVHATSFRVVSSADELTDDQVKELYKILDGAFKAQAENQHPDATDMEKFFSKVFHQWDSGKSIGLPVPEFPDMDEDYLHRESDLPSGRIDRGKGMEEVYTHIQIMINPPELKSWTVEDNDDDDFGSIVWEPYVEWASNYRDLATCLVKEVCSDFKQYNVDRALWNARRFLSGSKSYPSSGEDHGYRSLVAFLAWFPPLSPFVKDYIKSPPQLF